MKWLDDLSSEHGTAREGRAGLLYGMPGVGKSTILKRFALKRAGPSETAQDSVHPVVLIEVPSNPNEINLFDEFLKAMGVVSNGAGRPGSARSGVPPRSPTGPCTGAHRKPP